MISRHTKRENDMGNGKVVGNRKEQVIVEKARGDLLAEGARFSETIARLSPVAHIPKGVYRFASHEEANQHEEDCLVRAIAELALERRRNSRSVG